MLCPHECLIGEGQTGICRVRANDKMELSLPYYGVLSACAMDPIEKKPLFHFHPGTGILSAGFYGCNFRCPFCQNFHISQHVSDNPSKTNPEDLVGIAINRKSIGIAYTYSEPLVHFEYVLNTAKIARSHGLKNVLVTNGYIHAKPAEELLQYIDAANVDLKSFNGDFYRKEIKGSLEPVLAFIRQASQYICLEVTTLVIPGKNDSETEMRDISSFLASIDRDIPFHLSCYYPTYKYTVGATPPDLVIKLADIAREKLRFVYIGNVGAREVNTICPDCGSVLIRRRGYTVTIEDFENGKCKNCGSSIPIVA